MADEFDKLNELMASLGVKVKTTPDETAGRFVVAYGATGLGKTTTLTQTPGTILVEAQDESSEALKNSGNIPATLPVVTATGYHNCISILKSMTPQLGEKPMFKKIVIDGGSGMVRWCDRIIIDSHFKGDYDKFIDYGGDKGEKATLFLWLEFIEAIKDLRASGVWVYLICHSVIKNQRNTEGADYYKAIPHLGIGKDRTDLTVREADAILFFDTVIETKNEDKKTGKGGKAVGSQRVIKTDVHAAYEAKNRLNLPPIIELGNSPLEGARALHAAIQAGKKK